MNRLPTPHRRVDEPERAEVARRLELGAKDYGPGGRVSYPYLYERRPGELWITTMQGGLRMKLRVADLDVGEIPIYKAPVPKPPKPGGVVMFGDSTTALGESLAL